MTSSATPPHPFVLPRSLQRHLSATELRCAMLDGELTALGDGFVPVDVPISAAERAASLVETITDGRVILADRTAAWVWGWCLEPGPLRTCVSIAARIPSTDRRRLGAREAVIDDDEERSLAGIRVTTPLRTLVDLVRHADGADTVELVATGMRVSSIPLGDALAALDRRPRLAHVRRARARLAEADALLGSGQPLLTR